MIEQRFQDYVAEVERSIAERDWEAYGSLFTQDVAMRFPGAIGGTSGRQARVDFVKGIIRTFPDGRVTGIRAFGEGEWACFQYRFRGTNTGPATSLSGEELAATGKVAEFPYCIVGRMEDGIIAEFDEYFDRLEMLAQLGLVP